jgi:hypothetical protein
VTQGNPILIPFVFLGGISFSAVLWLVGSGVRIGVGAYVISTRSRFFFVV